MAQNIPGGCINQRNPSPTPRGGLNGVVHHALAFNTLLSSQETDACTIRRPFSGPASGAFVLLCCVSILAGLPGLGETGAVRTVSACPVESARISTTLLPGQPLQLTPTSASCQSCRHARFARTRVEGVPGGSPTRRFKAPGLFALQDEQYQDSHVTKTTCQPSPSLARPKRS
jgi:hypothetical protein